jgi:hypothetical protein
LPSLGGFVVVTDNDISDGYGHNNIVSAILKGGEPEYGYVVDSSEVFPEEHHKQKISTELEAEKTLRSSA